MLPTSPPIVSEKQLIADINSGINAKKQDKDWRVLFDIRFKLISKHFASNNYLHWPLMQILWWEMGHLKLMDTHKRLVSQRLQNAEQEIVGLQKALSAARAETAASLASTNVLPKDDELPASNDVPATIWPESSDVSNCFLPRNNNSISTNALPMAEKSGKVGDLPACCQETRLQILLPQELKLIL
jgi:hypothetical protein